jgi:hypothetical protein
MAKPLEALSNSHVLNVPLVFELFEAETPNSAMIGIRRKD